MQKCLDLTLEKQMLCMLVNQYSPLAFKPKMQQLLSEVYPGHNFSGYSKSELHRIFNDIIIHHYSGESYLKYELFRRHYKMKLVAAFEVRVNTSRADFLAINGVSSSYEIKSNLDNLDKLLKQSEDYTKVFEYNYLVTESKHLNKAKKLLPEGFGIWTIKGNRKKIEQEARPSQNIDAKSQLQLLTKKERSIGFEGSKGDINYILNRISNSQVNQSFKTILKHRYSKRWNFLVHNHHQILPVDLQFFFNKNIEPELVYS